MSDVEKEFCENVTKDINKEFDKQGLTKIRGRLIFVQNGYSLSIIKTTSVWQSLRRKLMGPDVAPVLFDSDELSGIFFNANADVTVIYIGYSYTNDGYTGLNLNALLISVLLWIIIKSRHFNNVHTVHAEVINSIMLYMLSKVGFKIYAVEEGFRVEVVQNAIDKLMREKSDLQAWETELKHFNMARAGDRNRILMTLEIPFRKMHKDETDAHDRMVEHIQKHLGKYAATPNPKAYGGGGGGAKRSMTDVSRQLVACGAVLTAATYTFLMP